jgi:hypothetical protein
MGSHATGCGAWCSGPEDISPDEYFWVHNEKINSTYTFNKFLPLDLW